MIVWLASYPRSGNTLLRIALNRTFGVRSSVVYDRDGVAERLGTGIVGFEERSGDYSVLRRSGVNFIKTHRQRDARVHEGDAATCLVRDGRDALVSYARQLSETDPQSYEARLQELIERDNPTGTGSWGANVLSWLEPQLETCAVLRFEDLAADPAGTVRRAIGTVAPSLRPHCHAPVPSFAELKHRDPAFFRRGRQGAWREEMPMRLHDLFWDRADNRTAMKLLGYPRD